MDKQLIKNRTIDFVKQQLAADSTGHDWDHVRRVWNMAVGLARHEGGDLFVIELAALLHDIADWKFHNGDERKGEELARQWLESLSVEDEIIQSVCRIIGEVSFKGAGVAIQMSSLESKIVQDADRLDALGAIGIARTFAYGGFKGRQMYNPEISPVLHQSFQQYKASQGTTINHFYEKLFLLKDLMNTQTAKRIAEERHRFMEDFVRRFKDDWEVKMPL